MEPRSHARDKVTQDESGGSGTFSRSLVPVMLCKLDVIGSNRKCGQPNKDSRLVDTEVYHSVFHSNVVYAYTLHRDSILSSELEFHTI